MSQQSLPVIRSTHKHRRPYLIREEAHPLRPGASVFHVYDQRLRSCFIGRETLEEAITVLLARELVSSITVVYRQDVLPHPNFQHALELLLGPDRTGPLELYFQSREEDEIERLLAVIGSLAEDLKVALNFATADGKIPGPYLRVFEQGIRDAEALLAFRPGEPRQEQ
jgi:hypothetical protein